MLRLFVLLLILANGLYFAWSHRIFSELGWGKTEQAEPHRLQQQINPERIRVLDTNDVPRQNQVSTQCWQTGIYTDKQIEPLRNRLSALMPANSWRIEEIASQQKWLIYMGKYANSSTFELKKAELKKMQLAFSPVNEGPMALGISLGQFPSQAQANEALNALNKRGIRTAKVVQEPFAGKTYQLVFPAIGTDLIPRINALTAAVSGSPLKSCNTKP